MGIFTPVSVIHIFMNNFVKNNFNQHNLFFFVREQPRTETVSYQEKWLVYRSVPFVKIVHTGLKSDWLMKFLIWFVDLASSSKEISPEIKINSYEIQSKFHWMWALWLGSRQDIGTLQGRFNL